MGSRGLRALALVLAAGALLHWAAPTPARAQTDANAPAPPPTGPATPVTPVPPLTPGPANGLAVPSVPQPPATTHSPLFRLPIDNRLAPALPQPQPTTPAAGAAQTVQPFGGTPPLPSVPSTEAPPAVSQLPPFGSQLFNHPAQLFGPVAFNRDYVVAPGDQISIQVWGSYNYSDVQGVDPQGNIFIPQVGPIRVAGHTNDELNRIVAIAVKRIFTQNVDVYATLLSKQPVAVYVTGAVKTPGRYSGDRMDSPLQYLAQAGGIDPSSGSYRDIRILRGGKRLAQIDLYSFLTGGGLPRIEFEVNDEIAVGFQWPTVTALGDVQNRYRFEIRPLSANGADLAALARPDPTVSNVSVRGIRNGSPYNAYVSLAQFRGMPVNGGDTLQFISDYVSPTIFVNVTGQSNGPSSFVVPRAVRLGEVLKLIEVDPAAADLDAIYVRRQSVAQQQQQALEEALDQLRRSVLTKTSVSTSDAAINTEEARLVEAFLQQMKAFRAQGIVVLADTPARDEFRLEPNDEIVIPAKSDVVLVTGEVRLPQSLTFVPGRTIESYIARSGGITDRADAAHYVVLHLSGAVESGGDTVRVQPGDRIMVMPRVDVHGVAVLSDLVRVLYEAVVSTGIALRLTR